MNISTEEAAIRLQSNFGVVVSFLEAKRVAQQLTSDATSSIAVSGRDIVTGLPQLLAVTADDLLPPEEPVGSPGKR